jgi:indolepyruvate ferredoxin oxidoreductase, beta subunit
MDMSDKTWNILMVGVGGQGVVLTSDIVATAAMLSGFDAKKSEIHGMSQRGGSVFSHVRFGAKVSSPVVSAGSADILVSFEEMETLRWLPYANADTAVFQSSTRILPADSEDYPEGVVPFLKGRFRKLSLVDADGLSKKAGNPKYLNVMIVALMSGLLPLGEKAWEEAIRACVPPRHLEKNLEAFRLALREGTGKR